jgi:hypothetical protein
MEAPASQSPAVLLHCVFRHSLGRFVRRRQEILARPHPVKMAARAPPSVAATVQHSFARAYPGFLASCAKPRSMNVRPILVKMAVLVSTKSMDFCAIARRRRWASCVRLKLVSTQPCTVAIHRPESLRAICLSRIQSPGNRLWSGPWST